MSRQQQNLEKLRSGLRISFIIHFITDTLFAVPLMVAPELFLSLFGWKSVDPITARIVSAALFGIGIESLIGREADLVSFVHLLRLKMIFSAAGFIGLLLSFWQGHFGPWYSALLFTGIFMFFNLLWIYWYHAVKRALNE